MGSCYRRVHSERSCLWCAVHLRRLRKFNGEGVQYKTWTYLYCLWSFYVPVLRNGSHIRSLGRSLRSSAATSSWRNNVLCRSSSYLIRNSDMAGLHRVRNRMWTRGRDFLLPVVFDRRNLLREIQGAGTRSRRYWLGLRNTLLVPFAKSIIDTEGWRNSYRILAVISAVGFLIGLVMVRRSPSQAPGVAGGHVRNVMRTREFKTISVAFGLMSMALMGSFAFVIKFAEDDGITPARAALLMSVVGASSILGRLLLTAVAGKLGSVRLLQIALIAQPVAYFFWIIANGRYYLLVIFAALLGLTYGGFVALAGDVVAFYFGLVGIGAVTGMLFFYSGFGSLIGPPIVGFLADLSTFRIVPVGAVFVMASLGAVVLLTASTKPVDFGPNQSTSLPDRETTVDNEKTSHRPTVFELEPV